MCPCLLIMTQKRHSDCFQKQYFRYLHIKKDLKIASLNPGRSEKQNRFYVLCTKFQRICTQYSLHLWSLQDGYDRIGRDLKRDSEIIEMATGLPDGKRTKPSPPQIVTTEWRHLCIYLFIFCLFCQSLCFISSGMLSFVF